ncbi:MAG TPA: serine hydrolase domain-containing protein [Fimbriimonadaceae bacterium]|nr:serine hydrolase domain-containing protein [Fimbriimonadaceae bacterium]
MDFKSLDALVSTAIQEGVFPGAAYAIGYRGKVVHRKAQGRHTYCPESKSTELDTVWDLASVSKVVGTTSGAMILYDEGKLDFDRPVAEIIPEFGQNGKSAITLRNLLLHNSGLIAFRAYQKTCTTPEEVIAAIYAEKLINPIGAKMVYSDLGMITFGKLIETVSGRSFTAFLNERVFQPLKMSDTLYTPVTQIRRRCAPTEGIEDWRANLRKQRGLDTPEVRELEKQPDGSSWITGEVHDPNAMVLAGVAGHAGLFSTVDDLCRFMAMMLNKGNGLFRPSTIELFTRRQNDSSSRALGWDTNRNHDASAGDLFSEASFGHTGYTGTCVWGDFENETFAVLLTNRVNPTSDNTKIVRWRAKFHDAAFRAIHG